MRSSSSAMTRASIAWCLRSRRVLPLPPVKRTQPSNPETTRAAAVIRPRYSPTEGTATSSSAEHADAKYPLMRLPSSTAIHATDSIDRASNSWSGAFDLRRATTAARNALCCFGLTPGSRSHDQTRSITSSIETLSLRPPDLAHSEKS